MAPRDLQFELPIPGHKAVDRILFPRRITRAEDGDVREELDLARYRIKPTLKSNLVEIKKQP